MGGGFFDVPLKKHCSVTQFIREMNISGTLRN
jgi:hypothetical protein